MGEEQIAPCSGAFVSVEVQPKVRYNVKDDSALGCGTDN